MTYNTKQKKNKKKTILLDKTIQTTDKKGFIMEISIEYSGSWYECPRVLKLTLIRVVHKFCYSHTTLKITNAL